jgi:hypothetical protein
VIGPAVDNTPGQWLVPGDLWVFVRTAHYVAAGALPYLYEADPAYVYPPGMAVLLAPAAAIGWSFRLSQSTTFRIDHPQLWLLLAPMGAATCVLPLAAVRRLTWSPGARGVVVQQLAATALLLPAVTLYCHFEEGIVLGCLLLMAWFLDRERVLAAAWALGAALLFKQTALLAAPVLFVGIPPGQRMAAAIRCFGPVASLWGICLAADWSHASMAILAARSFPAVGHAALWIGSRDESVVASPLRVLAFLASCGIAVAFRKQRSATAILAVLTLVMLIRLVSEPVVFSYYLTVPGAMGVLARYKSSGRHDAVALLFGMLCVFVAPLPHLLWWGAFGLGAGLLAWAMVSAARAA